MDRHEDIDDIGGKEDLVGHDAEDLAFLQPEPGEIAVNNPKPLQRLGWFSVICIICNRMIGKHSFRSSFLFQ